MTGKQQIDFDLYSIPEIVPVLLKRSLHTKWRRVLTVDRGCTALGHFFPTRLLKPLNPFIGYESHIQYVVFSVVITNQQPLSTVQRVNKIHRLMIVYGFYFTQCVCTGSIERSTLSQYIYIYIYIMYSCYYLAM